MPELPEVHRYNNTINSIGDTFSVARTTGPTKPNAGALPTFKPFKISSEVRGKELVLTFSSVNSGETIMLRFNHGLVGKWIFCSTQALDSVEGRRLEFITTDGKNCLTLSDTMKMASWSEGSWGPDRGPDPLDAHEEFCDNVMKHISHSDFKKQICEVMLNQKYFNGVGNYLRAEILHRANVNPFDIASTVLKSSKGPLLLQLCQDIPNEVLQKGLNKYGNDQELAKFNDWLRVYGKGPFQTVQKRKIYYSPAQLEEAASSKDSASSDSIPVKSKPGLAPKPKKAAPKKAAPKFKDHLQAPTQVTSAPSTLAIKPSPFTSFVPQKQSGNPDTRLSPSLTSTISSLEREGKIPPPLAQAMLQSSGTMNHAALISCMLQVFKVDGSLAELVDSVVHLLKKENPAVSAEQFLQPTSPKAVEFPFSTNIEPVINSLVHLSPEIERAVSRIDPSAVNTLKSVMASNPGLAASFFTVYGVDNDISELLDSFRRCAPKSGKETTWQNETATAINPLNTISTGSQPQQISFGALQALLPCSTKPQRKVITKKLKKPVTIEANDFPLISGPVPTVSSTSGYPQITCTEWRQALSTEMEKPYYKKLMSFVEAQRHRCEVFPDNEHVFHALNLCPLSKVKVVILGQDPYIQKGQAHGLCFSVQMGVPPPPSLVNIFKELHADTGIAIPSHGNLEQWAKQGVLLLNTLLTVEAHKPMSHANQGWETFTTEIINIVNQKETPVIFMLWGGPANTKAKLIRQPPHHILSAGHPSPLSVKHFLGCKHFSQANKLLDDEDQKQIDWSL
ncbi:uracil-DNA glycosylase [Pelomyxa schiedti]|nr:uracil-DNA glycosylase [Pelomyxa schiedti]